MQCHPEAPRLWEKHTYAIICEIEMNPTVHELCLYSGKFLGERIIFKRQVNNFAIAAPNQRVADHVLDLIDDRLRIPLKRQVLISHEHLTDKILYQSIV